MTHEQKLEAVRKVIIAAVPDIMKLDKNCKISVLPPQKLEVYPDAFKKPQNAYDTYYNNWVLIGADHCYDSGGAVKYYFIVSDRYYLGEEKPLSLISMPISIWDEMFKLGKIKITGRPIRLSDVLIAINHCQKNWHDENYGVAIELGENWNFIQLHTNEQGSCVWNLSNDDLNLQSPELIDFLYNLLK